LDFEPNHGNFVPHITLGRIKKVDDKKHFWKLIDTSKPDFTQVISIDEIILFQSKLTPSGPLYKVIETFSLTK
ncbi:MAG: 2'-5' RNA ligase family protein, partial [Bacteroidales bacterium]